MSKEHRELSDPYIPTRTRGELRAASGSWSEQPGSYTPTPTRGELPISVLILLTLSLFHPHAYARGVTVPASIRDYTGSRSPSPRTYLSGPQRPRMSKSNGFLISRNTGIERSANPPGKTRALWVRGWTRRARSPGRRALPSPTANLQYPPESAWVCFSRV